MSWPEVQIAKKENRYEIILSGPEVSKLISESGLDDNLFKISSLNYLNINTTCLSTLPDAIQELGGLQTLVLHSNKLSQLNEAISKLEKLKMIDVSRNCLTEFPQAVADMRNLSSLIACFNKIKSFPPLVVSSKLQVLDLANNALEKFPDICNKEMTGLTDLKLNGNLIDEIPAEIKHLTALKTFDIGDNQLKAIPGELVDCSKLKEINLKGNPIADRRLYKLIDQCRTKQILDYIRQHGIRTSSDTSNKSASKKGKKGKKEDAVPEEVDENLLKITVRRFTDKSPKIVLRNEIKKVREHIVGCLLLDLKFNTESYKKFIQMQNKLHDGICEKRNAATLATHDGNKIASDEILYYTAKPPKELVIIPLSRTAPVPVTGEQLFTKLQNEAEILRKEKKRNVYSGIHKYLYLLEGKKLYPCLLNEKEEVISFPPITNSQNTKISEETKSIFVEVTSDININICKKILDVFIRETALLLNCDLIIQQVKNTDVEGNLKSVYPSKTDLVYEEGLFNITREN